jgi:hypothetical protein
MFTAFAVGLGLTASLWAQVPNYVPTNGLVGWWPFNGNANDESGNGNNGIANNITYGTDRNGNANSTIEILGQSNRIVTINNPSNISGNKKTFSVWIKFPPTLSPGHWYNYMILCEPSVGYPSWMQILGNNPSYIPNAIYKFNYTGLQVVSNQLFNDNNWHNIICIADMDISLAKYYFDGVFVGSQNITVNQNLSSWNTIKFGNNLSDPNAVFAGVIDDIGIWNRALSECEIQDLYNAQINFVAGSIAVSPQPALTGSNVSLSTPSQSTNIQWQNNPLNNGWQNVPSNSNYIGGNTNTLTVNNVQLANHNQPFRVIATSGTCTDTSNIATIQIADTCITNVTLYDTLLTTVTDTLIINTTLSLPSPNNENTILIYPNPASDNITIDNGNFTAMAGYSIRIENNAGQQVFLSAINQAQFYVDLSTWTGNGLYFVHLIDPQNNTVTVRKIVLQ